MALGPLFPLHRFSWETSLIIHSLQKELIHSSHSSTDHSRASYLLYHIVLHTVTMYDSLLIRSKVCWSYIIISLFYHLMASVFSGTRINESWINRSHGFAIPRLYDTYHHFFCYHNVKWTYLCVCVCLLCISDILRLKSTFPCHGLDRYSLQHFSHGSPLSWLMSSSAPLQDENLYWRPDNIISTQWPTQLAIPHLQSCVAIPLFLCKEGDNAPAQK